MKLMTLLCLLLVSHGWSQHHQLLIEAESFSQK